MKQWFAYNHMAKIALVERGRRAQKSELGAFFDTWDEAHAHIVSRAKDRLTRARLDLQRAQGSYGNAVGLKKPEGA